MTFKTKEEMFGDGGGFGAAVPYSVANPPGTGAGNRGVQFGEQVTAAIANRSHYALALNDEDLNTRIVIYETGGLDAAYDLGAAAVAGGGRWVEKDAGALEVFSSHATTSGDTENDQVLFRANAIDDIVGIAVGFEFVSDRVGASGQTGNDGAAGFLDARVFAQAAGNTIITSSVGACLLNPGGALATTVRLGAGSFHTAGVTDLVLQMDLIEVSNDPTYSGLYVATTLGGTDADMIVRRLDGTVPAFAANTACIVRVLRPLFGTWGRFSSRTSLGGPTVIGAGVVVIPGAVSSVDTTASATALTVVPRTTGGAFAAGMNVDFLGRINSAGARAAIPTTLDKNYQGGSYAVRRDIAAVGDLGHVVTCDDATLTERHDFISLMPIDPASVGPAVTPNTVTMAFVAASPGTGELRFNAAQDSDLWGFTPVPGTYVEINGAYGGLYFILERTTTGNGGFLLRCMDGTIPAHFPAAGTCTLVALYHANIVGRLTSFIPTTPLDSGETGDAVVAANVFTAPYQDDGAALSLFGNYTNNDSALIRGYRPTGGAPTDAAIDEVFKVMNTGQVWAAQDINIGGSYLFKHITPPTRKIVISLHRAFIPDSGWSSATNPAADYFWTSSVNAKRLLFALNEYLREGMVINNIRGIIDPDNGGTGVMAFALYKTNPNFSVPAVPTLSLVASRVAASTALQTFALSATTVGETVVREGTNACDYWFIVTSSDAAGGDYLYALELEVTDPGPRNH